MIKQTMYNAAIYVNRKISGEVLINIILDETTANCN